MNNYKILSINDSIVPSKEEFNYTSTFTQIIYSPINDNKKNTLLQNLFNKLQTPQILVKDILNAVSLDEKFDSIPDIIHSIANSTQLKDRTKKKWIKNCFSIINHMDNNENKIEILNKISITLSKAKNISPKVKKRLYLRLEKMIYSIGNNPLIINGIGEFSLAISNDPDLAAHPKSSFYSKIMNKVHPIDFRHFIGDGINKILQSISKDNHLQDGQKETYFRLLLNLGNSIQDGPTKSSFLIELTLSISKNDGIDDNTKVDFLNSIIDGIESLTNDDLKFAVFKQLLNVINSGIQESHRNGLYQSILSNLDPICFDPLCLDDEKSRSVVNIAKGVMALQDLDITIKNKCINSIITVMVNSIDLSVKQQIIKVCRSLVYLGLENTENTENREQLKSWLTTLKTLDEKFDHLHI